MQKKKIGILTITPNIGFGGIMQAFALQTTVASIVDNVAVEIINYRNKPSIKSKLAFLKGALKRKLLKGEFVKYSEDSARSFIGQNVLTFHDEHLNFSPIVHPGQEFRDLIDARYDAVIVGSDQVWRPQYVLSIRDYFLEGVSESVSKIAYAASLGASTWEFGDDDTKSCGELINKFDYVSIRESEGVSLLKSNMNCSIEVYNDIDPTLLLTRDEYLKFVSPQEKGTVFTYVLDPSPDKESLVHKLARMLKLKVNAFNTGAENPNLALDQRVAPAVEDWLSGIANSDFVVTDSFHGCVFSIIFNKPFIVYANKNRGLHRFTSLLSSIGLQDRLIYSTEELESKALEEEINWSKVNDKLKSMRRESIRRLADALRKSQSLENREKVAELPRGG